MSFELKSLEKLVDRSIRDGVLINNALHPGQHVNRTGTSTKKSLHQPLSKVGYTLENMGTILVAYLDI